MSAATRSRVSSCPSDTQARSRPDSSRRMSTIAARTAGVDSRDGERPADPEQRPRLALARDRVLGSSALQRGQLADDDPDEQQQEQVHELARLRDGERVAWVDEQEVVEEERRDRREDRAPRPRHDGCRNDGDEVQRRWVGHARDRPAARRPRPLRQTARGQRPHTGGPTRVDRRLASIALSEHRRARQPTRAHFDSPLQHTVAPKKARHLLTPRRSTTAHERLPRAAGAC